MARAVQALFALVATCAAEQVALLQTYSDADCTAVTAEMYFIAGECLKSGNQFYKATCTETAATLTFYTDSACIKVSQGSEMHAFTCDQSAMQGKCKETAVVGWIEEFEDAACDESQPSTTTAIVTEMTQCHPGGGGFQKFTVADGTITYTVYSSSDATCSEPRQTLEAACTDTCTLSEQGRSFKASCKNAETMLP